MKKSNTRNKYLLLFIWLLILSVCMICYTIHLRFVSNTLNHDSLLVWPVLHTPLNHVSLILLVTIFGMTPIIPEYINGATILLVRQLYTELSLNWLATICTDNDTALQTNLKHSMRTAMSFPELVEHGWLLSEEVFKLKLKRWFEVNQMCKQSTMQ